MNNKIVLTKRTSAVFLAIVLVTGTFALASPSFMVGASAQAQPYYGMDNNNRKSYGNDNNYNSYYKSQKDSKSDFINKIKCINTNLNINGNNTGDVNLGNKGQAAYAEEGYSGAYSSAGSGGYGGEGYYDDGQNYKKDKGFDCVTNNNENSVSGGGTGTIGSQGPPGPRGLAGPQGPAGPSTISTTNVYTIVGEPDNEIFTNDFGSSVAVCDLGDTALSGSFVTTFVGGLGTHPVVVSSKPLANETGWNATGLQNSSGQGTVTADVVCFDNPPAHVEMAAADVSTFQQPEDAVIMSQGLVNSQGISQVTEDSSDLSAMEKITKLKTQWLNQLP